MKWTRIKGLYKVSQISISNLSHNLSWKTWIFKKKKVRKIVFSLFFNAIFYSKSENPRAWHISYFQCCLSNGDNITFCRPFFIFEDVPTCSWPCSKRNAKWKKTELDRSRKCLHFSAPLHLCKVQQKNNLVRFALCPAKGSISPTLLSKWTGAFEVNSITQFQQQKYASISASGHK